MQDFVPWRTNGWTLNNDGLEFGRGFYAFNCMDFGCPNCWFFGFCFSHSQYHLLRDMCPESWLPPQCEQWKKTPVPWLFRGEDVRDEILPRGSLLTNQDFNGKYPKYPKSFFRGLCFRRPIFLDINQPSTNLPTCYLEIRPPIWPWLRETNGGRPPIWPWIRETNGGLQCLPKAGNVVRILCLIGGE